MLSKNIRLVNLQKDEVSFGIKVKIEENVKLIGIGAEPKNFLIGDNVYIGENVKIIGNDIKIMDYTTIHNHCFLYAPKPLCIGYNCWIGQNTILNADDELIIKNNVGIGAYSQLWTHIKFGDTLEGCNFNSYKKLIIEDDVWFVGHCIVSPIHAKKKSMAMVGSVIVKDMEENHIYAGSPAKDMTNKIGFQFSDFTMEQKYQKMKNYLSDFFINIHKNNTENFEIVLEYPKKLDDNTTYFNIKDRTYTKRNTDIEHKFMEYLLPEKAKFIPRGI